ncbi:hypothetical protein [Candidatus Chlamydia sanziniae]|uniref:Uncharacterized protein n=1 Tax=Candidatus Chlamydia sanziniae TaxID=1806891 RepID=A0A1A9HX84_9CHLA|nr:hypothetical protein [Candidatus Chlamydia sanziniae]ANH79051.1 hypothetical protein Cs308_0881 [Candidatus Chlamydia sanziniae]
MTTSAAPSPTFSPMQPVPPPLISKHPKCSWKFLKPILISLILTILAITSVALITTSGVVLGIGIGIVLAIQLLTAGIALVYLIFYCKSSYEALNKNHYIKL